METCTMEGCGKEFKSPMALRTHMRWHKTKQESKPPDESAVDTDSARLRSDSRSETLAEKVVRLRKERIPIGSPEKKWSCPDNDGYHYRVFNDEWMTRPDNIERAKRAGYEFVQSDDAKQKSQIVGTNDNGTPIRGYLMRIPKEIFDEDQRVKQKGVDLVDKQIKSGRLQSGAGDGRYIPTTGIKIHEDTRVPE